MSMSRSVLITGATSGIGRALAVQLAARGWRVVASGRSRDALATLQSETGCEVVAANLSDSSAAVHLFERAWNQLNGVDVLVNGAGMNQQKVRWRRLRYWIGTRIWHSTYGLRWCCVERR